MLRVHARSHRWHPGSEMDRIAQFISMGEETKQYMVGITEPQKMLGGWEVAEPQNDRWLGNHNRRFPKI